MSQNYQVFIRSTDVGAANPVVVGMYPETRPVDNDTHAATSIYMLPIEAIVQPTDATGYVPTLVDNWQSMIIASSMGAMHVEANFALSAQVESLRETVEAMMKYGTDVTKWPPDVRTKKNTVDEKWKYVDAVKETMRTKAGSHELASSKSWPTPPKQ